MSFERRVILMGMLPVFFVGFLVGFILTYAVYLYKKDTPSETKFHIQQATIIRLQADIEALTEENKKLQEKLLENKNK